MTKARHAAYNPRKLIITMAISLAVVALLAVIGSPRTHRATADPKPVTTTAPAPQPTWTSYLPTTPQECRDAMDAADAVRAASEQLHGADLAVTELAAKGQYAKASQKVKAAQRANGAYGKAVDAYKAQAKRCRTK